jgi:hypothetical protein
MLPYLLTLDEHGVDAAIDSCADLRRGIYLWRGKRP